MLFYCNFVSWVKASSHHTSHGSHHGSHVPALKSPIQCRLCSPQWCTKGLNTGFTQQWYPCKWVPAASLWWLALQNAMYLTTQHGALIYERGTPWWSLKFIQYLPIHNLMHPKHLSNPFASWSIRDRECPGQYSDSKNWFTIGKFSLQGQLWLR